MASAAKTTISELTDFISCPVCLEQYSDAEEAQPKVLQCGHSVCRKCLFGIIGSSAAVARSSLRIPCPECRDEGDYGTRSVDQLPTNVSLKSLTRQIKQEKGEQSHVTISCDTEGCDHSTPGPGASWSPSDIWICRDCGHSILCASCVVKSHGTHAKDTLAESVKKQCSDLEEKIDSLRPQAAQYDQITLTLSAMKEKTKVLITEINRIKDAVDEIESDMGAVETPTESFAEQLLDIEQQVKMLKDRNSKVSSDPDSFTEQKSKVEQLIIDITVLESRCSEQIGSLKQCVDHSTSRMNHAFAELSRLSLVHNSNNSNMEAIAGKSDTPKKPCMHVFQYLYGAASSLSMRVLDLESRHWTENTQVSIPNPGSAADVSVKIMFMFDEVIMTVTGVGNSIDGLMLYTLDGDHLEIGFRLGAPQRYVSEYYTKQESFSYTAPFLTVSCYDRHNVLCSILLYDIEKFSKRCINIPSPRRISSARTVYVRNSIWRIGGRHCNTVFILNLADMSWVPGPSTHMACCNHRAHFFYLPDLNLLCSTGGGCSDDCRRNFEFLQLHDGGLGGDGRTEWIQGPKLVKRSKVRSHFCWDGRLNLVCGCGYGSFVQSIALNDFEAGWRLEESMFPGMEPWFVGISKVD